MKNIYTKITLLLFSFILQLYLPASVDAQCLCGGGVPATALSYLQVVPPSQSSNTIFSFPKFDPAVGTLSCLRFDDTLTVMVTTVARNTDTTKGHNYKFLTSINAEVNGPRNSGPYNWTASAASNDTTYGPYFLDKDTLPRLPTDSITIGPDTLINNMIGSASPPDIAPFLGGSGVVNFSLDLSGGALASSGGTNYTAGLRSNSWGAFRLTYYYCPNSLLASGLQNFSASKQDKNIILKWEAQNAANINQYEIEYSVDGISFTTVAKLAGSHTNTGTYSYNYMLNGSSSGYVYFRIKQTGNDDKSAYSAVQKVLLNEKTTMGVSIRPNPVVTGMSVAFDRPLNGDYSVDLVNLSGQVIFNKKVKMINSNIIPVNWSNKPAPGIYFTRITNTSSMEQQIVRVIVQ